MKGIRSRSCEDLQSNEVELLFSTVVSGGYCIGCGACATVTGSPIRMELDEWGRYQAVISNEELDQQGADVLGVCPFSQTATNEDDLAKQLFATQAKYHSKIGYHMATYAGHVNESDFHEKGSSGGMAKWIVHRLFEDNLIDAVIQVEQRSNPNSPLLYTFAVAESQGQARKGSKAAYYPVEMSEVLTYMRSAPGRYAIVGLPCFIKAVRLLAGQDSVLRSRIHYCIGLVCGHLKSSRYADSLGWQFGIEPGQLNTIDFRKKLPGMKANQKGVYVQGMRRGEVLEGEDIVQNLFGTNYGHGFFKYKACDFCDDVVAETADVSVGDAWLPDYLNAGNSIVVVRNPTIASILRAGIQDELVSLEEVSTTDVVKSQASGLRHRREGLSYRLYMTDRRGNWRPPKRVKACRTHINWKWRRIFAFRVRLTGESYIAFDEALQLKDFTIFKRKMTTLIRAYERLYLPPWRSLLSGALDALGLKAFVSRLLRRPQS